MLISLLYFRQLAEVSEMTKIYIIKNWRQHGTIMSALEKESQASCNLEKGNDKVSQEKFTKKISHRESTHEHGNSSIHKININW